MPAQQKTKPSASRMLGLVLPLFVAASTLLARGQTSVTTYHYDNFRTGWNSHETKLTPANVNTASFGLLHTVTLDDQVDAQPLLVPGVMITAGQYQGTTHDVVYVVTENNTVYAIDANTGTILLSPNFGAPVSYPLGCTNNGPNVGITSTPVIDPASKTLYVMVYTQSGNSQSYKLHALDLGSLTDKVTPVQVKASHTLTDGTTFTFNATYHRQRPALLLANGDIYAAFGSFCDYAADNSRGWLLGWTASTLKPFPSNQLLDQQASDASDFFLSAIWMSGYGPATDDSGNVLFVTGNSDSRSYDGITNIQESVVKVSSTLTTVQSVFTPSDQPTLDEYDNDFGSGGVLVLPDQPGSIPHLAVAAGKNGKMYLMNEDNLGGYSSTKNNVLGTYGIGGCWCGQSYFVDPSDGLGRVVTSGGKTVSVWKILTTPKVALKKTISSAVSGAQDPGFFTSISSNGSGNPIIWALSHPPNTAKAPIYLFAFNPESGGTKMKLLFKAQAGAWPNLGGNANLVPVVANGLVFVGSNQQLQIFGLKPGSSH
jgi:outer membrane protein assembly factor BamB